MKQKWIYSLLITGGLLESLPVFSQIDTLVNILSDTLQTNTSLDEIVITSNPINKQTAFKGNIASIDEHLLLLRHVDVIKRGNYAWEPTVNNMQTERLSITIDGMKIFSACTDRMDPVTSYVESGNLQRISLNSGIEGNPQATGNIGGSIDLKLRKAGFGKEQHKCIFSTGLESNGLLQMYGIDAVLSDSNFYGNMGLFYRHAGNYNAGGNDEISFSQFTKTNAFINIGWKPDKHNIVETTFIYDIAANVGYPALNMDVKKAESLITSLSYRREQLYGLFTQWETKIYYNKLVHNMDDTHRPDVVIHMDMPGRSSTAGLYSLLSGFYGQHEYRLNYDLYFNTLYADMTMYPEGQTPMFMLTWPDVATLNNGIALNDEIYLNNKHRLRLSMKGSWQHRTVRSNEGFSALKIYFPNMTRSKIQWQGRIALGYVYECDNKNLSIGIGYGCRTPTVTEEFGYFINNTFDRYDYIGNPNLKNESAIEANFAVSMQNKRLLLKTEGNIFFFKNYIIGTPMNNLSAMTLGAAGVKIYRNMSNAHVINLSSDCDWFLSKQISWKTRLTYAYGKESTGARLPLISPVTCKTSIEASLCKFTIEAGAKLCARYSDYSKKYGETAVSGYTVYHINVAYPLNMNSYSLLLSGGIENLFDRRYTTYSDWNHILQKGRNYFINASFSFGK